jgi:outer membrane beta-barrel protein
MRSSEKRQQQWGARALLVLLWLVETPVSFAAEDSEYNFSWLDPDKKIYVLQNRRYRKAETIEAYALGGTSLGDPYRTVLQVQPRLAYWFTESTGLEVFYSARFHSTNNTYRAMKSAIDQSNNAFQFSPQIREVTSQFGLLFNWAPWYSKINVFNSILHFDWYFSAGFGAMTSEFGPLTKQEASGAGWASENLFAVYLGTGHLFHLDEHWTARLDVLGHFFYARDEATLPKSLYSNFAFNLGIGYQL